ncbi:protein-L-isoaspartate(D-aspartate) O-methyltransferase [Gimesia maris]|uniref:protein-L-isoaspartate(D-aspartate) O-methyltransferase n=1 Tax=Gimesia maris TaxID=122 RepID=UPI00241CE98E|nr:protein-L-isoaspartate(D-aspartate) O-methyltransferase [Gimesia maris]|tara:strand:- start:53103 stop:53792 length:690 start_codon:yes stop_codon:yes gene_type:complete
MSSNSDSVQSDDNFISARQTMIEQHLRQREITDPRVLEAIARVPREQFVPPESQRFAYNDCALPIDCHQTISQPYTVAFMCAAAQLTGNEVVLEIGTGSGYGAAVLSLLAREVHTIERIPALASQAAERLQRLGYDNVHVYTEDGTLGLPQAAPFDAIIVTASSEELPEPYQVQLSEGGRIIIPLGSESTGQRMYRFTLNNGKLSEEVLGAFVFVPLIGKYGHRSDHPE